MIKNKVMFCPGCFEKQEFTKTIDIIEHNIRGEKIKNKISKYICSNCGKSRILDEDFDQSLLKALNKYRQRNNMLAPDKIKEIRMMYGLSQRAFAKLLGWGQVTIHRYENGSLQDNVHDQMLKFLINPENMIVLLNDNKKVISEKVYNKVKKKAGRLIEQQKSIYYSDLIVQLQNYNPAFTGNKTFDIEKFSNLVLYFAQNIQELWKTKLIKLIWYAEFLHYKRSGHSICGTPFIHWNLGPVPEHVYGLLDILSREIHAIKIEEMVKPYCQGDVIINIEHFNKTLFSENELDTLDIILTTFSSYNSTELINKTHEEKAYRETSNNQIIPYEFANSLSIG